MMKAEDLDTASEDHIADEARYACMSRPWVPPTRPTEKPKRDRYDRRRDDDEDAEAWKTV